MKVNLCLYIMMYVIVVERYFVDQSKTGRVTKLLANAVKESMLFG
jgi:hypothetical protein